MTDTNVIKLAQPGTFADLLTDILRNGARALLTQAVETEVADFLGRYADLKTEAGHQRVVRHTNCWNRQGCPIFQLIDHSCVKRRSTQFPFFVH